MDFEVLGLSYVVARKYDLFDWFFVFEKMGV